jgi:hypothetical protein
MAKNDETVEKTVTIKRKNLKLAGWIAGGALALGATFAIGAAVGHEIPSPFGGDFASAPGHIGDGDGDHGFGGGAQGGPQGGDRDGDHGGPQGGFQAPSQGGQNGQTAPSAPSAPAPTAPTTP